MAKKTVKGRPTVYTSELAATICERLATGETLRSICRDEGMPDESTVRHWAAENRKAKPTDEEGFFPQYARARDIGMDAIADEILEVADDGSNDWMKKETEAGRIIESVDHEHVTRSRLRVDTRKWYLSKMAPKRYGDKMELTGKDGNPLITLLGRIDGNTADL